MDSYLYFQGIPAPEEEESFDLAAACLGLIHKRKTLAQVSLGSGIDRIVIAADQSTVETLARVIDDVVSAGQAGQYSLEKSSDLEPGRLEIVDITYAAE